MKKMLLEAMDYEPSFEWSRTRQGEGGSVIGDRISVMYDAAALTAVLATVPAPVASVASVVSVTGAVKVTDGVKAALEISSSANSRRRAC